jgi:hypothetical protein
MGVPVNFVAILIAAIANMVLGYIWYGPLFGKAWMKLSQIKMDKMKSSGMGKSYALMFLGSLVMAWVLAHALVFGNAYLHTSGAQSGIMVGFFNWLGFVAPVMLSSVLWDGKPWKLWLLNSGYYLIGLMLMGVILASL